MQSIFIITLYTHIHTKKKKVESSVGLEEEGG